MAGKHLIHDSFTTGIYEHVQCHSHIHPRFKKDDIICTFLLENKNNYGISPTNIRLQVFYPKKHSYAIEN